MQLPILLLCCLLLTMPVAASTNGVEWAHFPGQSLLVGDPELGGLGLDWPGLERFYRLRDGTVRWHDQGHLNAWGVRLFKAIQDVRGQGLEPADYHLSSLASMPEITRGRALWRRELLLSDGALRLPRDLHSGHYPADRFDPQWQIPAEPFDPVDSLSELRSVAELEALLADLPPATADYRRLLQALADYRVIEGLGGWPVIEAGPTLRPGGRDPRVPPLRRHLRLTGDLSGAEANDPRLYDQELVKAVRRFQYRHGLRVDGLVGSLTRASLNVPVGRRILQLRANLERWRWMPQDLGERYLLVNTAGFDIRLLVAGKTLFRQRTINGKRHWQTPSFASRITRLVINPSWTVPRKIAVEELLPRQQADAGFLEARRIEVFRKTRGEWVRLDPREVDWSQYDKNNFPFMLRQLPGEKNSLGRVKFDMANPYAIYLHDTPVKSLFERPVRAFSHGCVRVNHAEELARRLLDAGGQASGQTFDKVWHLGQTEIEQLALPIPVYLVYFTSWVEEDGRVQFRPDIYQRNRRLLAALARSMRSDQPEATATASVQGPR